MYNTKAVVYYKIKKNIIAALLPKKLNGYNPFGKKNKKPNLLFMKTLCIVAILSTLLIATNCLSQHTQTITVSNLKVEGRSGMNGIEQQHPGFSWQIFSTSRNIVQTGYQIIVAKSLNKIDENIGDVWSSKKINSAVSVNIVYPLQNLLSGKQYYWKVKVFTNKGQTQWSAPGKWSMGIMDSSLWKASWIGLDTITKNDDPFNIFTRLSARYMRKEVTVNKKVARAMAYVCGLGLYELYINGTKVGNDVLAPTVKEYNKAVPYNTLDVTNYLKNGNNALGVILGNGRFFTPRYSKDGGMVNGNSPSTHYGMPKLLLQIKIEYTDGSDQLITSDNTWKATSNGPILANNEFDGETYDANKELNGWCLPKYNDGGWSKAQLVIAPEGKLVTQTNENISIKDSLQPIAITKTKNNTYILDMGQNMVGWLKIKVQGNKGDTITLRFAETLKNKDSLYLENIRGAKVTDTYILKGGVKEVWQPRFVYHGFRFVEITGLQQMPAKNNFTGMVVYDNLPTIGSFQTSNKTINQVYKNAYWGIRGNYRGMPTDCPQRDERMGWLGDRSISSYGESFIFDNSRLYAKWMDDIKDAQKPSGSLADVAPTYWKIYSDDVTWPISYLIIPEMLRRQFGDELTFKKHYPFMKKWMMYMWDTYQIDGLVEKDTYGDWCLPPESPTLIFSLDSTRNTKGPLIGAAYYYYALTLMKNFALLLDLKEDITVYGQMSEKVKAAFNTKFYNADSGYYANNTVTSNLLPLTFGLVPDKDKQKVFNHIVTRTLNMYDGHVSTGLIGGQWLMRGLTKNGRPDIAYKIATNTTYPSWGYMATQGATTIWELWNGNTANPAMNSGNHVMLLGDLLVWNYENLAGIKADTSELAFKKIRMDPYLAPGLQFVNATTTSPYGKIKSSWRRDKNNFTWDVAIPANSSAILALPVSDFNKISDNKIALDKVDGVKFLYTTDGKTYIQVGSGNYSFTCKVNTEVQPLQ